MSLDPFDLIDTRMCYHANGSVTRTLAEKLGDVVTVKDFGAVGDGAADDTAALNAALACGEMVLLPRGTYKITAPLTGAVNGSGLIGAGRNSIIAPAYTSGDVFTLGNGSAEVSGLHFENFLIWPSVIMTSGYAFNARLVTDSAWIGVYVSSLDHYAAAGDTHRVKNGYYFDRFAECRVLGGQILCSDTGIKCRGNADSSFGVELMIGDNLRFVRCGVAAIHVGGGAGGIKLAQMDASLCYVGVQIDDTLQPGTPNREIFLLPGCAIDASITYGVNLDNNSVSLLEMDGVWISSSGVSSALGNGIGIRTAPSSGVRPEIRMNSCRIYNNTYDGCQFNDSTAVMDGCIVSNNGSGASGGHGIYLVTSEASPTIITNCYIHNNGTGNSSRGYGVKISAAGTNNFVISSNIFISNSQGSVYNSVGSDGNKILSHNVGFATEKAGVATISSGNNSVIVAHGLGFVPSVVLISAAGPIDGGSYYYVNPSDTTDSQFVIRCSANVSMDRYVAYRASYGAN